MAIHISISHAGHPIEASHQEYNESYWGIFRKIKAEISPLQPMFKSVPF
jgi:hypothetical protein